MQWVDAVTPSSSSPQGQAILPLSACFSFILFPGLICGLFLLSKQLRHIINGPLLLLSLHSYLQYQRSVCWHTILSAAQCASPLSLCVCQLGKVSTKWAECKQCPGYWGQEQPVSHSWRPATTTCDVHGQPSPVRRCPSPSSSSPHSLHLFLSLLSFSTLLSCSAFGHFSLFFPPTNFSAWFSSLPPPCVCPSLPSFPPLLRSPHQSPSGGT